MGKRKSRPSTSSKPTKGKGRRGGGRRRAAPGSADTLAEVVAALKRAALVREEEVTPPGGEEAPAQEPAALSAGLWDRLRRALFTRVRVGGREKPLAEILREAHWVDPEELARAEAEVAGTAGALGKLLLDRGLISPETLRTARRIQQETDQPLWRALLRLDALLPEQLLDVLRQEVYLPFLDSKDVRLGEALMELDLLSRQQLDAALRLRRKTSRPFGQLLLESGLISEEQLTLGLARQYGVDMVDLSKDPPEPEAFEQLPTELIVEHRAMPIRYRPPGPGRPGGGELVVACAEPHSIRYLRNLGALLGLTVRPVLAPKRQVEEAIQMAQRKTRRKAKAKEPAASPAQPPPATPEPSPPEPPVAEVAQRPNIVDLVDSILSGAVRVRATDIHLDPQEGDPVTFGPTAARRSSGACLRVRYRIDGVLHDVLRIPASATSGVITRLKVMANLDIVERRLPQDAHLTVTLEERPVNMRVASVPTEVGEKLVLRVLDESRIITSLDRLGLEPQQRDLIEGFLARPYGMFLVVGPVGSGKTTTLYSCMTRVNSPARNLMSIEDPVEYRLAGANQLQVFRRIGFDFAAGLRAILRQDPDVIMVGEIRDDETAKTAVRAALTGVFVMSSVHAQDAPATIGALYNFGIPGFLVSTAVIGIVAQRLVRRVCPECRVDYRPNAALLRQLGLPIRGKARPQAFYRGEGCEHCFHTGYYGRTGIFEVMPVDEEIKDLVFRETTKEVLAQVARDLGMQSLRQSGLNRVLEGTTTVEEFFRVIWT